MRKLIVFASEDLATSNIFPVLQLRTVDGPWLPRLKTFVCEKAGRALIPFISSFLSLKTTDIMVMFTEDPPAVVLASAIISFSALCPDLEYIILIGLPRDPVITDAVSELLLGCNQDTLRVLQVDSPLTEEAREVAYRLPRLSQLWAVIQGPTSLPTVALPNLRRIDVEYDHLDWLRGFRGGALEKLEEVLFLSKSEQVGDFLGAFESVALTTSIQNTLSTLKFYTRHSWNPNYSSLLSFKQLKELEIEFSCYDGCSSKIDDDTIASLAGTMPKLEVLRLGHAPCRTPTGATVNGLIDLACRCPNLSKLCIHFQAASLVEAATSAVTQSPTSGELPIRRKDCALVDLEVGEIPMSAGSALTVALILLHIFPHILKVKYVSREWKAVAETITDFRRIGTFVHHSSKAHSSYLMILSDGIPEDTINAGRPPEDGQA